jgi:hypothetical protein
MFIFFFSKEKYGKLAVGCWLLAVGCWLLAVGCWLLAVGCWLLAVGCFILSENLLFVKRFQPNHVVSIKLRPIFVPYCILYFAKP